MRLFVLGATGRTGKEILELALARGHEVTAFVRSPQKLAARERPRLEDRPAAAPRGDERGDVSHGAQRVSHKALRLVPRRRGVHARRRRPRRAPGGDRGRIAMNAYASDRNLAEWQKHRGQLL